MFGACVRVFLCMQNKAQSFKIVLNENGSEMDRISASIRQYNLNFTLYKNIVCLSI